MIRFIISVGALLMLPALAQAHLLPKQNATMRIIGNTANFVVSVPISALAGIDDDADGELSEQEIHEHDAQIKQQFSNRFTVSNNGKRGRGFMLSIMSPHTDGSHNHNDYVVILHRVKFDEVPSNPIITTNLFGTRKDETNMTMRATLGNKQETVILSASNSEHEFFKPSDTMPTEIEN